MTKIVKVNFDGLNTTSDYKSKGKIYYYLTKLTDLEIGDVLVVQSFETVTLANFVGYVEGEATHQPHKWVINKTDISFHKHLQEIEKKKQAVQEKIEKRYREFSDIDKKRLIAKFDAQMARLFEEIDELDELEGKESSYDVESEIKRVQLETVF